MLKEDVIWPRSRRYKTHSPWEPAGFFSECLCNSTRFDLMLGFFSSSAISILSDGFATFLYNGGRMRLIINDILMEADKDAIQKGSGNTLVNAFDLNDIEKLRSTLSKRDRHFFECLAWLIRNEKIEIKVIAPISSEGIAHTKCGLFSDGLSKVAFDGSVNFSGTALIANKESLTIDCSWDGDIEVEKIKDIEKEFQMTFNGKDPTVNYLDASSIKTRIAEGFDNKEISELLKEEYSVLDSSHDLALPASVICALSNARQKVMATIQRTKASQEYEEQAQDGNPRFPYSSGPREYQKIAFDNWKRNGQKGLFAMATGTGKTITSLNCLLEIYRHSHYYKALILVPTVTLVDQWEVECKKFNFNTIIKVCSKNKNWKNAIDSLKTRELLHKDKPLSYVIICTYASYGKMEVFTELNEFSKKQLLLIADEAHNMGAPNIIHKIDAIPYLRRIGLSATPDRQFDDYGNKKIREFFCSEEQYTYEYSMEEAIRNKVLCQYNYYPHVVHLTDAEMSEYLKISVRLAKMYNFKKETFDSSDPVLTSLLIKRKRIIHKAINKLDVFKEIISDRLKQKGNLKYTLVYVPEGNYPDTYEADNFGSRDIILDDPDSEHIIELYSQAIRDAGEKITVRQYTSHTKEKEEILRDFADGTLDVLTSMKCLDEGVDVPRSELAIFCSSTGNPRQFIQRRGRILRTHKDKLEATIHDLVVMPAIAVDSECYNMERNLVKAELKRVRNFALLSKNLEYTDQAIRGILDYYKLSLFE